MLSIISLGLGVQSTALYYMSSMGQLPRADYAIFVDTGKEKKETLVYLKYLKAWQNDHNGVPVIVVRKKNLYKDLLNSQNSTGQRFSSIPAFTKNPDGTTGMLRRQCTNEYKIEMVDRGIRQVLAVNRINQEVEVYKGISLDELERMSIPQVNWKVHVYPFCNYSIRKGGSIRSDFTVMTRLDLINWYILHNFPIPPKSSCVFCPYQSDAAWYDMKVNALSDFKAACRVDKAIRNSSKKGISNPVFLHSSCIPLEEIEFSPGLPDLWHGECSGSCHT